MNNYLSEAFKKLDILDEDVFELDKDGLTALKDFEDSDEDDTITVVDPDAESEEDLEDSYIGKVILDCSVCHTDIYKDKEDITIDDESGLANIGEECPYCYSSDGFKVIGEVKPFVEVEVDTDDDVDVEVDGEEVEEDEEKNESLRGYKKIAESISKKDKRFLNEAARLNFKKFGIDRLPEEDFSDDGTRFRMFVCDGMPISFARYAGKVYLAIRPDYLSELSYKEYSKLPTYRDCDKYNGVPEEDVDLSDVAEICKKLKAEYDEAVDRKLNNTSKNESFRRKSLKESTNETFRLNDVHIRSDDDYAPTSLVKDWFPNASYISITDYDDGDGFLVAKVEGSFDCIFNGLRDLSMDDVEGTVESIMEDNDLSLDEVKKLALEYGVLDEDDFEFYLNEAILKRNIRLKESCSINQCQKWVDYDMKKYKKISDDTMEKIKSSGYSVVKDQYGDYEVIADRKDESCGNRKPRKIEEDTKSKTIRVGSSQLTIPEFRKWMKQNPDYKIWCKNNKCILGIDDDSHYSKSMDFNDVVKLRKDKFFASKIEDDLLEESIEDITIDTGDQEITVSAKDKEEIESDDEMIAPLSDEVKSDIEMGSDDTVDVDVDDFSEEDFDELGENYLKKVYENVDSYRTISAKTKGNKLYLEGLIKFNSGKEKKTSFVFESRTITRTGKAKLIGENLQISRGHKSFKLTGTINNGKFISESLNYNYRVKNGNESQRVYGTAKKSK